MQRYRAITIPRHQSNMVSDVERIDLETFLLIAETTTGISAQRLGSDPRLVQLASSALAAPWAGFGNVEIYPTIHAKAGGLCLTDRS